MFSNKKKTICATLNLVFASTVKYFQFFERTVQKRSHWKDWKYHLTDIWYVFFFFLFKIKSVYNIYIYIYICYHIIYNKYIYIIYYIYYIYYHIIYIIYIYLYIYIYILYIHHVFFNYKHKLKVHTSLFTQNPLIEYTPPDNFIILVSSSFTNFSFILSLSVLHSKG